MLQLVLAWSGERSPDALAITAAGAALAVSDIPCSKPVAGVRVGWPRASAAPVVNPTLAQMEDSQLDLVIAGTADAVLMIEGFCDFLSDEQMLQAVTAGQAGIRVACDAIAEWCVARAARCALRVQRVADHPSGCPPRGQGGACG